MRQRIDQRALPPDKLATADAVYAYSFIATNLGVSTPDKAAAVGHWYRHRTSIENVFFLRGFPTRSFSRRHRCDELRFR